MNAPLPGHKRPRGRPCKDPADVDVPTPAMRKMQQAEAQQDFARACRLVEQQATAVARETRKQMLATGTHACPEYWDAIANRAHLALRYWQIGQEWPLSVLLACLRADGLDIYADAIIGDLSWTELVF